MPSCAIRFSSRISTCDAGVAGHRGGAPGEFARRQRVARLVGELARKIAALAEHASARHAGGRGVEDVQSASGTTTVQVGGAAGGGSPVL